MAQELASIQSLAPDPRDALLLGECNDGEAYPAGIDRDDRIEELCNAPVTEEEVTLAFAKARLNGANGPDAFPAHFMRHAPPPLVTAFTTLFDTSFTHGVLPTIWRAANATLLFKGKGANPTDVTAWRPISLTSVVVKVLERILLARLVAVAGPRLHSAQHGFRAGFSCDNHTFGLRADIEQRTVKRHSRLPVAFVDVAHAFDGLWHSAILHQLWRLGVRGALWRWLRAWLTGRRIRVVYDGVASQWYFTTAGAPQGGVVSPFLSNSFFDFFATLPGALAMCVLRLFADDIALYARALHRTARRSLAREHALLRLVLASALKQLSDAFIERRCRANVPKCGVVTFTRPFPGRSRVAYHRDAAADGKRGEPVTVDELIASSGAQWVMRMHGVVVPAVPQYVYLGVLFHQSLKWDAHCVRTIARVRASAAHISRVLPAAGTSGPRPAVVRHLVVSLLLPVIAYGAHVWSPFSCRRLDSLQNAYATPLRIALGLPRSAHLASVLAECGVPNLRALFDRALLAFVARTTASPHAALRDAMIPFVCERPLLAPTVLGDFAAAHLRFFGTPHTLAPGDVAVAYPSDAESLGRAMLRSSLRAWAERPLAQRECRELVPYRLGRGGAVPVGGERDADAITNGTDAGLADYVTAMSRVAVRMCARLRLNRSYVADSLHRRGMLASPLCARCARPPRPPSPLRVGRQRRQAISPPPPLRVGRQLRGVAAADRARSPPPRPDTVEHFLLHCPGPPPADALDAARAHFRDLFGPLAGYPPHVAVRALLGGPLPASHADHARRPVGFSHLPRLSAFYEWLVAHDLAQ